MITAANKSSKTRKPTPARLFSLPPLKEVFARAFPLVPVNNANKSDAASQAPGPSGAPASGVPAPAPVPAAGSGSGTDSSASGSQAPQVFRKHKVPSAAPEIMQGVVQAAIEQLLKHAVDASLIRHAESIQADKARAAPMDESADDDDDGADDQKSAKKKKKTPKRGPALVLDFDSVLIAVAGFSRSMGNRLVLKEDVFPKTSENREESAEAKAFRETFTALAKAIKPPKRAPRPPAPKKKKPAATAEGAAGATGEETESEDDEVEEKGGKKVQKTEAERKAAKAEKERLLQLEITAREERAREEGRNQVFRDMEKNNPEMYKNIMMMFKRQGPDAGIAGFGAGSGIIGSGAGDVATRVPPPIASVALGAPGSWPARLHASPQETGSMGTLVPGSIAAPVPIVNPVVLPPPPAPAAVPEPVQRSSYPVYDGGAGDAEGLGAADVTPMEEGDENDGGEEVPAPAAVAPKKKTTKTKKTKQAAELGLTKGRRRSSRTRGSSRGSGNNNKKAEEAEEVEEDQKSVATSDAEDE